MINLFTDLNNMKLNLTFISLSRRKKIWLINSVFLILLLVYLDIYEFIYIIPEGNIINNLVPVDYSHLENVCPLSPVEVTSTTSLTSCSVSSLGGTEAI